MNNRIKIPVIVCALALMLLGISCERDFDEINSDPNLVVDVPADYLLPGIIMSISSAENDFMASFAYASDWVQHISCATWPDPGRYNYEKSRNFMWDQLYTGPLMDLKVMNAKAVQDENGGLRAVSMILYSYAVAMLADSYGPVPFTQALAAEKGINKPAYDPEELIIHALLDSLSLANELLGKFAEIDIQDGYDVLLNGDAKQWQKLGNALRLRMLMRISFKDETFSAEGIEQLISGPGSPLPESRSDNIHFVYPGTSPPNYHPLYDVLSEEASDGGYRLSKTLADLMLATSDPRLAVYALENENGEYAGLENGLVTGAADIDLYSRINTVYGKKDRPGIFFSYSETAFLLAEAAARSITTENPESYYREAIRASFMDNGLSDADFDLFLSSPSVSYDGLEKIYVQKWISLFGRGMEAWAEYRRTGTPDLSPATDALINSIPSRFLYPISEEQSNFAEMQKAVEMLPDGDALTSKIWWMQ